MRRQVASPLARISGAHLAMVAAALVGGGLTYRLLATADQRTDIAVLRHSVAAGQRISTSDLRWESVRFDDSTSRLVVTRSQTAMLNRRVARHALSADALLAPSDIIPTATGRDGLAAMSVSIDRGHAVGGDLQSGDHVDVLAEASATGRVADNLEVTRVDSGEGGPLGRSGDKIIVTLALSREDAVNLAAATRAGDIDLIKTTGLGRAPTLTPRPNAIDGASDGETRTSSPTSLISKSGA